MHISRIPSLAIIILLTVEAKGTFGSLRAPADVAEGSCKKVQTIDESPILPIIFNRLYYVVFGSESMFQTYAETFLGRPAVSKKELTDLCLTVFMTGPAFTTIGYENQAIVSLGEILEQGVYEFASTLAATNGVRPHVYTDSLVWSDGRSGLLIRCVGHTVKDWKVISIERPSDETFKIILKLVEEFGFNPDLAIDPRDTKCPNAHHNVSTIAPKILQQLEQERKGSTTKNLLFYASPFPGLPKEAVSSSLAELYSSLM